MKKLELEQTVNTPLVIFDPENQMFKIEGRSIPENPGEFFDHLIEWFKDYFEDPLNQTTLNLNLEYVNSGSSKHLLGLLRILKKHYDSGRSVEVNWYYEEDDEAIQSLGEHYKATLRIPFNLIEYI